MKYRTESTLTNITSNYTFGSETISGAASTESLSDISGSLTPEAITLTTDSATSYKVTVNVHSGNVETYNATANSASTIGPLSFDCYEVVTSASDANFSNQLTFVESTGSSLPSWLTFNASTASVSISNPSAASSDTYNITNTYTGSLGNTFALNTSLTINIVEGTTTSDDDHCLNASSEGFCALFAILIAVGVLATLIIIGVILYCKLRKPRTGRTRVEQLDPAEANNADNSNEITTRHHNVNAYDEAVDIEKFADEEGKQA